MKIIQKKVKVISNTNIIGNYYKLTLDGPQIVQQAKPGQFLNIQLNNSYEPFLRRPFSIHRIKGSNIEILYEVVGHGTQILSQKKAGEYLDVIGPLGNGYSLLATRYSLLVAGGMGVAPLIFLAERLIKVKSQKSKVKTMVLIGAKTKSHILCEKEFKVLGCEVKIATEDGSSGFKGRVTDLLKYLLSTTDYRPSTIYACGPKLMLKEISYISKKHKIPTQVSLEEHMACGFGVCLGCAVKTRDGYRRVCKEGPVFEANQIDW